MINKPPLGSTRVVAFIIIIVVVSLGVAAGLLSRRDIDVAERRHIDDSVVSPGPMYSKSRIVGIDDDVSQTSMIDIVRVVPIDIVTGMCVPAVRCFIGGTEYHRESVPIERAEFCVPASNLDPEGAMLRFEVAAHAGPETYQTRFPKDYVMEANGLALAMLPFMSQSHVTFLNLDSSQAKRVVVSALPLPSASSHNAAARDADMADLQRRFMPDLIHRGIDSGVAEEAASAPGVDIEFREDLQMHVVSSQHTGALLLKCSLEGYAPVQRLVDVTRGSVTHVHLNMWEKPTVAGVVLLDGKPFAAAKLSISCSAYFDDTESVPKLGGGGAGSTVWRVRGESRAQIGQVRSVTTNSQGEFAFPFAYTGKIGIAISYPDGWPTIWRRELDSKYESLYWVLSMQSEGYPRRFMRVIDDETGNPMPGSVVQPAIANDPFTIKHPFLTASTDGYIDVTGLDENESYRFRMVQPPGPDGSESGPSPFKLVRATVRQGADIRFGR